MIINFYVLMLTPRYVNGVEKSGYEQRRLDKGFDLFFSP